MKKYLWTISAILLLTFVSCKDKIDIEKEKEAIMTLVKGETDAWLARDYEKWSSLYVMDSTALHTTGNPYNYAIQKGWDNMFPNARQSFSNKPEVNNQVKIPIGMKIYKETAWVLFETHTINDNGQQSGDQIKTYFLEKHDGNWKIVYVNNIQNQSYISSNNFATSLISYAKSLGKSIEEIAGYVGDQFKTGWNLAGGITALSNNLVTYWSSMAPYGKFKVLERDDNHIVIRADNVIRNLKTGPQFNVTYDDYLTYMKVMYERIADYLGVTYTQETTADGVLITASTK